MKRRRADDILRILMLNNDAETEEILQEMPNLAENIENTPPCNNDEQNITRDAKPEENFPKMPNLTEKTEDTPQCHNDEQNIIRDADTDENLREVEMSNITEKVENTPACNNDEQNIIRHVETNENFHEISNITENNNSQNLIGKETFNGGQVSSGLKSSSSSSRSHTTTSSSSTTSESSADLSDYDRTFRPDGMTVRDRSSSSSSSSSTSAEITNDARTDTKRLSRKRTRNPSGWKQNKAKIMRNRGLAYTSLSKSKKEIPARNVQQSCNNCRLRCSENITEEKRHELFNAYWSSQNLETKRAYLNSCMMEVKPRYKYTNAAKPRSANTAFYFTVDSQKIRVCKRYFMNTLNITDRQIRTTKMKRDAHGFIQEDLRGKHGKNKTIDPIILEDIKNHIQAIPRIESHFLRASTSREYIGGDKNIKDLWRDYVQAQQGQNKPSAEYWLYAKVFNTEFNLGFFQPKKDRCDFCLEYDISNNQRKDEIKEKYDRHKNEKELCRQQKREDRKNISATHICAVYDLQAIMQCPTGDTSAFYYKSKLNCFNFTIAELSKKIGKESGQKKGDEEDLSAYGNVYCSFWDETEGKRGANEIGSCVLNYLKELSEKNLDKNIDVTFYSDNCCGQNKNKYMLCLYSYAVANFSNIRSITHKYLIKGHTQNEGDNVHSLIEKEIKKNLKSGPIYSPIQYVTLIKNAKKSGHSFRVQEMNYENFKDLKHLQEEWGYNFNEDDDKKQVLMNDIKVLKFVQEDQFSFYYKVSYNDNEFRRVDMRNKRKKMKSFDEIILRNAFTKKLELSEAKKKDLKELIKKNLIPSYYISFYDTIL